MKSASTFPKIIGWSGERVYVAVTGTPPLSVKVAVMVTSLVLSR